MERHDEENLYVRKYGKGGSGGSSASGVSYDDTQTQLHATNVQEAIEALDSLCDFNEQQIETLSANKQNKLIEGDGILITNDVISVKTLYDSENETLTIGL